MSRSVSREERKKAFLANAEEMFERMESWYDNHPEATFGEIEHQARQERREMMGKNLSILINGRNTGKKEEHNCPVCDGKMRFKGYRSKWIQGLEGDSELERAYYVCPNCKGETSFPPR